MGRHRAPEPLAPPRDGLGLRATRWALLAVAGVVVLGVGALVALLVFLLAGMLAVSVP